jgi:hypothetical protein
MAVIEVILTVALDVPLPALGMSMRTNVANRPAELRLPGPPLREHGSDLQGGELTPSALQHMQDGDQLRTWMDDDAHQPRKGSYAVARWRRSRNLALRSGRRSQRAVPAARDRSGSHEWCPAWSAHAPRCAAAARRSRSVRFSHQNLPSADV